MKYIGDIKTSTDGFVSVSAAKLELSKDSSKTTISRFGKTSAPLKPDFTKDKEIIHHGLQRLRSSVAVTPSRVPARYTSQNKRTLNRSTFPTQVERQSKLIDSAKLMNEVGTMTDLIQDEKPVDLDNSVLSKEQSYKDMQWSDPRLLRKYCLVKNQSYKKSRTIPIVDKSDVGNALLAETTDDEEEEVEKLEKKHVIIREVVTVIGAICGITLIAMVIWKVLENDLLKVILGLRREPPPEEYGLKSYIKYFGGFLIYVVNNTLKKVLHFLTLPTSDVFLGNPEESFWISTYFNSYMEYLTRDQ